MIISEKQLDQLDNIIKIQCSNGNYNYNSYMYGLANGLILARALMIGGAPIFLEVPENWIEDIELQESEETEAISNE